VGLHDLELTIAQLTGLQQHAVGDADLTYVVQGAGEEDVLDELQAQGVGEALGYQKLLRQGSAVAADALEVPAGLGVPRLRKLGEGEDRYVARLQGEDSLAGLNAENELGGIVGLPDEVVGACGEPLDHITALLIVGQQDGVDVIGKTVGTDETAQVRAADTGSVPRRDQDPYVVVPQDV
jgi:hypothetical protein